MLCFDKLVVPVMLFRFFTGTNSLYIDSLDLCKTIVLQSAWQMFLRCGIARDFRSQMLS